MARALIGFGLVAFCIGGIAIGVVQAKKEMALTHPPVVADKSEALAKWLVTHDIAEYLPYGEAKCFHRDLIGATVEHQQQCAANLIVWHMYFSGELM